jgi:hypothetical protein
VWSPRRASFQRCHMLALGTAAGKPSRKRIVDARFALHTRVQYTSHPITTTTRRAVSDREP